MDPKTMRYHHDNATGVVTLTFGSALHDDVIFLLQALATAYEEANLRVEAANKSKDDNEKIEKLLETTGLWEFAAFLSGEEPADDVDVEIRTRPRRVEQRTGKQE